MELRVGFVISHPSETSLGSIVRVRDLMYNLSKVNVECYIYTPFSWNICYEENIVLRRIRTSASQLRFTDKIYNIMKRTLRNPFLSRNMLLRKKTLNKIIDNFAGQLLKTISEDDLDIVHGEQEIAAAACTRIRDKLKKPVIAGFQNIWPEELVAMNIIKRESRQFKMMQEIEREIIESADKVIVDYEGIKHYMKSHYNVPFNHVTVIPLGGKPRIKEIKEKSSTPKVAYVGLVTYRAHVDLFVKSMPIVLQKNPEIEFYITRRGDALKDIKKLAENLQVAPEFFWYTDEDIFIEFLASCHIGVLPSSSDTARKIGIPVKLFDYMSVGLPIVANDIGTWTNIIKEEKVGIVTEDNPHSFAYAIQELSENKELSLEYGRRGLELMKTKFNSRNSARKLFEEYKKLLGKE